MSPILGIWASAQQGQFLTAFDSIATVIVGSGGSSSITFSSIPSTYKHLQIRIFAQPTTTGDATLNLNGSNGTYVHQLYGNGSAVSAGASASQGYIDAGAVSTSYPAAYVIDILDYTNTNKTKVVRDLFGYDANGSGRVGIDSMLYNTTSAVTSFSITGRSWASGSHFALYGIKG